MAFFPSLFHPYPWRWKLTSILRSKNPPCTYNYSLNKNKQRENWHLLGNFFKVLFFPPSNISFKLIKSLVTLWFLRCYFGFKPGWNAQSSPLPTLSFPRLEMFAWTQSLQYSSICLFPCFWLVSEIVMSFYFSDECLYWSHWLWIQAEQPGMNSGIITLLRARM